MKMILFILFFGVFYSSTGQIKIEGVVLQADSTPLSYANIGIKLKNLGTVSDINGVFTLPIPHQFMEDTLTITYVGFDDLNIPLKSLPESPKHDFLLHTKTTALKEVVIRSRKLKQKKTGTKSHNPFLFGSAVSKDKNDIIEFVKLIRINNRISKIQSAHIYLRSVDTDTATFRINFYSSDNGLPGQKIVDKNIIRRMAVKSGWLVVDLTEEKIVLDDNFFVGFEFMPEKDQQKKYSFSYGGQIGGNCIVRKSSLGSWEEEKGASLSAYVTLLQ